MLELASILQPAIDLEGNKVLIELLVNNLLINDIRHTSPGGIIQLRLAENEVWIANSGNWPLNPDTLFQRFRIKWAIRPEAD